MSKEDQQHAKLLEKKINHCDEDFLKKKQRQKGCRGRAKAEEEKERAEKELEQLKAAALDENCKAQIKQFVQRNFNTSEKAQQTLEKGITIYHFGI